MRRAQFDSLIRRLEEELNGSIGVTDVDILDRLNVCLNGKAGKEF